MDEIVVTIRGKKHWLWSAVDQDGFVLDVLVRAAETGQRRGGSRASSLRGQQQRRES
jgi:putative transposase